MLLDGARNAVDASDNRYAEKTLPRSRRLSVASMVDDIRERRERRRQKPQPWIARKFTIFITACIMVYALYVVVGRVCVPALKRERTALGGRATGVGLLVGYTVLWIMMAWSYIKIVVTPPGYALEITPTAGTCPSGPAPVQPPPSAYHSAPAPRGDSYLHFDDALGIPYQAMPERPRRNAAASGQPLKNAVSEPQPLKPAHSRRGRHNHGKGSSSHTHGNGTPASPGWDHNSLNGGTAHFSESSWQPHGDGLPPAAANYGIDVPYEPYEYGENPRQPSAVPILRSEYRYCRRCQIDRPPRTHHCRICGTCVLRYDHHCPWIGQCVGARNHKFFLIFTFWAAVFCMFALGSLIGLNVMGSRRPGYDIDPQHIVVIALAGLFVTFTIPLGTMHAKLILDNTTTVEQLSFRSQHERQSERMSNIFSWWQLRAKSRLRAQWDHEWGRIGKEGNLWWLGKGRRNWEEVMGKNLWTWLFPIGRAPNDGWYFERNPRFNSDGVWLPKKRWPADLQ